MRARTVFLLIFAVVLAVGTALLARSWLASQRARELAQAPVTAPAPVRQVLVAHAAIARGQILRPEDVVWQVWPAGTIAKDYVLNSGPKKPESYTGWVAVSPIGSGQPITTANVISPGNRGFLAAVLRPGTRAITVPVTLTSGIAGFIFPGDEVDILLTYPIPKPKAAAATGQSNYEHRAAETMLRHIRVIGVDQRLEMKPGTAAVAHTVTFEVTPKQSEVIVLASEVGRLSLVLDSLAGSKSEPAADHGAARPQVAADSFDAAAVTYTIDSEIDPLLPKFVSGKEPSAQSTVTILRGAAKTSEATDLSKRAGTAPGPAGSAGGT
ncbi:MAG TPA: Flp pilus assembly protein CpaB [Stellaceae bacterium]|nr:Flp pilus assembly protein CpaB [Stellaceae bacterium]